MHLLVVGANTGIVANVLLHLVWQQRPFSQRAGTAVLRFRAGRQRPDREPGGGPPGGDGRQVLLPLEATTPLAFRLALPRPATAAEEVWEVCGRIVGGILAAGKLMTLDQVVAASEQALAERPDGTQVNSHVVAYCLLQLAGAGVVEVLQAEVKG